ncbi:filamentous hemagglutinin N-terminal domain-containing protein [Parahaliea mediterranea]|uniref:filamentous hemagglutinin N-terminal domain-containing protein n=1 Tax=Parahaliea mediterranea TaxID=651086 RepID=UPI0013001A6E|nr:filamentous hemagglutinin N-terminal domain-containing protein [Parahaliea mediterranea]
MTSSKLPTLPRRWRLLPLCLAVATASYGLRTAPAVAGPEGGRITGGSGAISSAGHNTRVEQLSHLLSIQWDSFNIDRHESVDFLQPHSSSVVLNQILQNGPSQIQGRINANGHVLLINPRGVIFGENAKVNVGAMTASTLWLDKDDFLNGEWMLRTLAGEGGEGVEGREGQEGVVVNSGIINAASGVTLLGEQVRNEGLITAQLGYINLVSGREAFLTFDQEGFLGVKVSEEVVDNLLDRKASVQNSGALSAPGGRVLLEANVSRGLFDSAVNNSGIIEAQGFGTQAAGSVHVLGDTVHLAGGSVIDASGGAGDGGEILIGGDYRGGADHRGGAYHHESAERGDNAQIQNATDTRVDAGALLKADAGVNGDGGRVIVWADGATTFAGDIQARGGSAAGNGGFAEVSGKQYLQISGHADLSATAGDAGKLLLDPGSVAIVDGADTAPAPDFNIINDGWINAQLGTGDLEVTTSASTDGATPDITVNDSVEIELASQTLTLTAGEDISLGAATFNDGSLVLNIGQSANGVLDIGTATFTTASVSVSGGSAGDTLQGASAVTLSAADAGTANGQNFSDISFSGIENLVGTAGDDTFTVAGGSLSGTIDGAGGSDTIEGSASYLIDGTDEGVANSGQTVETAFSNVENLTGTADDDTFAFTAAGSFSNGQVNGGAGGDDTVTYAGPVTHTAGVDAIAVDTVIANGGGTLTAATAASFELVGADEAVVEVNGNGGIRYNGFGQLQGSAASDTFDITAGSVSVGIDGGGVADNDTLLGASAYEISGANAGTANPGMANAVAFSNIESLVGTAADDTFTFAGGTLSGSIDGAGTGDSDTVLGSTAYAINGADAGVANSGQAVETTFSNIENLTGTAGADTFSLVGGSLSGAIDGGGVNDGDTLQGATAYTLTGTDSGTVGAADFSGIENLTGSSGADTFTFAGGTLSGTIDGAGGSDTIEGSASYLIDGTDEGVANSGQTVETAFSSVENLTGTAGDDTFAFTATGSLSNGQVNGGAGGDDTVTYAGPVTHTAGVDAIAVDTVIANGGGTLAAATAASFELVGVDEAVVEVNGNGGIRYNGFGQLQGSVASDTFDITAGSVSVGIDGGGVADNDTLLGASAYEISGANAGTANPGMANAVAFSNIESLVGTAADDTFTFAGGTLSGSIDGAGTGDSDTVLGSTAYTINNADAGVANSGQTVETTFSNIENLTGSSGVDTFTFAGGTLSGAIDGGADSDTMIGASTYVVSADNSGTADTLGAAGFSNIENLTGTDNPDTFTFSGGTLSGAVAGLGENDTFTFAGGTLTGPINGGDGSDEIAGLSAYDITDENQGQANGIDFTGVENLTGTTGNDVFNFLVAGALAGTIDGVSGTDDTIRFAATILYTAGQTGQNIDIVEANGSGDTLTVTGASSFVQSAPGQTEISGSPVIYRGFENLLGSSGNDSFDLSAAGVTGQVDGGGGTDTLQGVAGANVTGANTGTVQAGGLTTAFMGIANLQGTAGDNVFTFAPGGSISGTVAGLAGNDTLAGANSYTITSANGGSSSVGAFTDIENLHGSAGDDTFTLQGGSFTGNLVGLAGTDTLAGVSDVTVSAANAGTDGSIVFSEMESITGTPGDDLFTFLAGGSLSGLIDGLLGDDTLAGGSVYEITGVNRGTANLLGAGFENVENLSGTTGNDTFTFLTSDRLSGVVDGVSGDADTIRFTATVTYTAGMDGLNIDIVQAEAANDTLTVAGASSFVQTANNSTRINGGPVIYSGFENLLGSSGNDGFDLAGFGVSGSIGGGAGADQLLGASVYRITGANSGTADGGLFSGIETVIGSAGNDLFSLEGGSLAGAIDGRGGSDTLQGAATVSVNGSNSGTADGFVFSAIENLRGTAGNDTFTLAGGSVDGLIDGLGGTDAIIGGSTYRISGANAGSVDGGSFSGIENLTGSAAGDSFEFLAGGSLSGLIDAAGGSDSLTLAPGSGNSVDITAPATLRVNGATEVRNVETVSRTGRLSASGIAATFDLVGNDGVRLVTPAPSVTFSGVSLLSGNGNESLSLNGAGVQLQASGFTIGGGGLAVSNIGTINGTGAVSGSGVGETFTLSGTSLTVDTQAGNTFLGVTQILGNGGVDTLQNQGAGVTLGSGDFITGGGVRVGGVEQVLSTGDLTGSAQQEQFSKEDDLIQVSTFNALNFGGVVELDGGEGNDTLIGASTYVLLGQNAGTADGQVFLNVENLHGSAGDDTFTRRGGSLSGTIDGLGGSGDHLIGFSRFVVGGAGAGTADGIGFAGIESLTGTGGAGDVLEGVSDVQLTERDGGIADDFRFRQIANLLGTAGADRFVAAGGSLSGSIDGAGSDGDRLENFSLFELADGGQGGSGRADGMAFTGIEVLTGTDGAGDRLVGGRDYVISGENSGTVAALIRFIGIENLTGTSGDDSFVREQGGRLDGTIDGAGQGADGDRLANYSQFALDAASAGEPRSGTADGSRFVDIEVLEGSGAAGDTLSGAASYRIDGADAGLADDSIRFSRIANLTGTDGDDRFVRGDNGSLSGVMDALGEGSNGDALENFSAYQLDLASGAGGRSGTADGTVFRNIERLAGTAGDNDSLSGASDYRLDGLNRGTADALRFSGIENLTGTDGDDRFDLAGGRVSGVIRGAATVDAVDSDTLLGVNAYVLEGDNSGLAQQRDATGQLLSSVGFESIENLVGTDGNDTFQLGGNRLSGSIDGLAGLDVLSLDQSSGASRDVGITLAGNDAARVRIGTGDDGFSYAGIEDLLLSLAGNLTLDGAGQLSSSRDIVIGGDFTLNGPTSDPPLVLRSGGNLTIDGSLALSRRSVVDVSSEGSLLTIGGGLSVDTAGGAQINAVIVITVTGEPVIQLEVEETTSLSIFDDIAVFNAGRRSVSRRNLQGVSDEIENEGQLIKALQAAAGP